VVGGAHDNIIVGIYLKTFLVDFDNPKVKNILYIVNQTYI